MIVLPETVVLPLKQDEDGTIRVSGTRVTLDTLIGFYQQGETPEELSAGFTTVPLADIYAVIAYYLSHRAEVDTYLKQRQQEAERIRQEWESRNPPVTKTELLARLDKKRRGD
ncbi:MAG: DUF433 domain-containing protein [Chloroflexi bacterium]|nr:DUF433 domain-containing protein [Chloroflexota bacterium]